MEKRIKDWKGDARRAGFSVLQFVKMAGFSGMRAAQRYFKKNVGQSPREWMDSLRQLEGHERLEKGEDPKAVAIDMGYKSTSSFCAAQKRVFGVAPCLPRSAMAAFAPPEPIVIPNPQSGANPNGPNGKPEKDGANGHGPKLSI